ncbi:MAG: polyisoprenoid-binding protein [Propionibacteriaceae bacterium]|mgnify:CR=1 FL=1|nr:polyisoprenoid-binding protein [Propionibacteriaceae bacterium]
MSTTTTAIATLADVKGTFTLDASHSRIGFVTRHAMVTKVRGAFNDVTGTATVDGSNPNDSSLSVEIAAASIDTRDAGRDGHLVSPDFLDAATYPALTFVANNFAVTGPDTLEVTGGLTIKGITKTITIPFTFEGAAVDPFGNQRVGFEGSTAISRKDWGLTWNAALETGGVLVSDKVVLEFEVSAIKAA